MAPAARDSAAPDNVANRAAAPASAPAPAKPAESASIAAAESKKSESMSDAAAQSRRSDQALLKQKADNSIAQPEDWLRRIDDLLREFSRIFAALFREDERGVGLVITKTCVSRRHDLASGRQTGRGQRVSQLAGQQILERLHERVRKNNRRSIRVTQGNCAHPGLSSRSAAGRSGTSLKSPSSRREEAFIPTARSALLGMTILPLRCSRRPISAEASEKWPGSLLSYRRCRDFHGRCDRLGTWRSRRGCGDGFGIDFSAR